MVIRQNYCYDKNKGIINPFYLTHMATTKLDDNVKCYVNKTERFLGHYNLGKLI